MRMGLSSKDAGERYAAADRLLRHWERLSRLEGLDAPARTDVTSGGEKLDIVLNWRTLEKAEDKPG